MPKPAPNKTLHASVASTDRTSITRASMGVGSVIRADRSITRLDAATVPSIDSGSSIAASMVCPWVTARCSM